MSNLFPKTTVVSIAQRSARRGWPPSLITGAAILGLFLVAYLLTLVIPGWSAYAVSDDTFASPSFDHWLGTDNLGRDSFVRISQAAVLGVVISFFSAVIAAVIGSTVGIVSAYLGGKTESILMRGVDLLLAIPAILMALMIRVIVGPGVLPLIISLGIIFSPVFARIMHAAALTVKHRDFVTAARIASRHPIGIMVRHILPNTSTPLLVAFASVASEAVVLESALSYLGQGVQPPDPSAGRMIDEFQKFALSDPLLIAIPCVAIIFLASAWNLIADGIQVLLQPDRGTPGAKRWGRKAMVRRVIEAAPTTGGPATVLEQPERK